MTKSVPRITVLSEVWAESAVSSLRPGNGFVTLRCLDEDGNSMIGQFEPELARKVALDIVEAAGASEVDAGLLWALDKVFEGDEATAQTAASMIFGLIREFRDAP